MVDNIRSIFRLYKLYAVMDLKWLIQDWTNTIIILVSESLQTVSSLAGVLLLAIRFGGVGGMTADEVLFLLGFYELAHGVAWVMFGNYNIAHISRRLGRGQVDHMLIQPRPLWMQMLTEGFMPFSGSFGLILGVVLTAIAVSRLQLTLTPLWFLLLLYYILMHVVLRLSQSALYGSLAFWYPVACEEISSTILDMNTQVARFPLVGLPNWLMTIFHTVLPIGLMAYLPALALLRDLGIHIEITLPFVVAGVFVTAAVIMFQKGLKHYEQYSCQRYKDMGHRC